MASLNLIHTALSGEDEKALTKEEAGMRSEVFNYSPKITTFG